MDGLLTVIDILLINCYILAYLHINYENDKSVAKLEKMIDTQRASIEFYLEHYPKIMIRMLINLVDYYRISGFVSEAIYILDVAEKCCKNLQLYDALFDIFFNRLVISIQFNVDKNATKYFRKIDSYFRLVDKKFKKKYIQKKYDYIKSLYEAYYNKEKTDI